MKLIRMLFILSVFLFTSLVYAGPVDINTADAKTLAANIKGVGVKKAKAIVSYRDTYGAFQSVDDIVKVKGIGNKLLEKNREVLVVKSQSDISR